MNNLKTGLYILRSPEPSHLALQLVKEWLQSSLFQDFKSCVWLTTEQPLTIYEHLQPLLQTQTHQPDLSVISIADTLQKPIQPKAHQTLCRQLNTVILQSPCLVILEHANHWIHTPQNPAEPNTLNQIQLIQAWIDYRQLCLILPTANELPTWSTFAHGLGASKTHPSTSTNLTTDWWPTPWGVQTTLWQNEPGHTPTRSLFDADSTPHLGQLAQAIYHERFSTSSAVTIDVLAGQHLSPIEHTLLLRLGADRIFTQIDPIDQTDNNQNLQPPIPNITHINPNITHQHTDTNEQFAHDWHELWTPGQRTLQTAPHFCAHSLLALQQAPRWNLYTSTSHCSLLPHVTSFEVAALLNPFNTQACILATTHALYLFRVWGHPPTPEDLQTWLQTCFREHLDAIFGGQNHYTDPLIQQQLIVGLSQEHASILQANLEHHATNETQRLADVWYQAQEQRQQHPWLKALSTQLGLNPQDVQEETLS